MWGVHYRKERVAYLNQKDAAWQKELADSQGPIAPLPDHDHEEYDDTTSGAAPRPPQRPANARPPPQCKAAGVCWNFPLKALRVVLQLDLSHLPVAGPSSRQSLAAGKGISPPRCRRKPQRACLPQGVLRLVRRCGGRR